MNGYDVIFYDVVCWYFFQKTKCMMKFKIAAGVCVRPWLNQICLMSVCCGACLLHTNW